MEFSFIGGLNCSRFCVWAFEFLDHYFGSFFLAFSDRNMLPYQFSHRFRRKLEQGNWKSLCDFRWKLKRKQENFGLQNFFFVSFGFRCSNLLWPWITQKKIWVKGTCKSYITNVDPTLKKCPYRAIWDWFMSIRGNYIRNKWPWIIFTV